MDNLNYQQTSLIETVQSYWIFILAILVTCYLYFSTSKKSIKSIFKGGS